jgi:predicted RNA-binding Zn ribbon-like protein
MHEALPSILTIPLVTEKPCLNFVNTVAWRLNPTLLQDYLNTYTDLLAFCLRINTLSVDAYTQLIDLAAASQLFADRAFAEARTFRNTLTSIIDILTKKSSSREEHSAEALAIFDAARRKAHESEVLSIGKNRLFLFPLARDEGLNLPWLYLVRDAEELLCSHSAQQIRVCSADGCGRVFLDHSKNGTRRWCSMQLCGNREKAIRFKAKA